MKNQSLSCLMVMLFSLASVSLAQAQSTPVTPTLNSATTTPMSGAPNPVTSKVSLDTPQVEVSYVDAEKFTDATFKARQRVNEDLLDQLTLHMQMLGKKYLPASSKLEIDVLDIDIAGNFDRINPMFRDVRLLNSVTWPVMKVHYQLVRDGKTTTANEVISDAAYLDKFNNYANSDRLRYEKAMLDRWFAERFRQPLEGS